MGATELKTATGTIAALSISAGLVGVLSFALRPAPRQDPEGTPSVHQDQGYVGAAGCKSCHPGSYDSWSHTYHRGMTRKITELFDGPTDEVPDLPVVLTLDDVQYRIERAHGGMAFTGPDLDYIGQKLAQLRAIPDASGAWKLNQARRLFAKAPRVKRDFVLVTGSHHYLAFWVSSGPARPLRQLPFVYFLDERRWIPRREAFLQPSDSFPHVPRFNANCIQCHTVAGRPKQAEGIDEFSGEFWETYESDVAELGIACEACHGPGKNHVELYKNPLKRLSVAEASNCRIFVPRQNNPDASGATCGQCHSYFLPNSPAKWWESGFTGDYFPGESLAGSRAIIQATANRVDKGGAIDHLSANEDQLFWADGSIMVGGREYNGLLASPCHQLGAGARKMTCVSCHSMHQGAPKGQLKPEYQGANENDMCLQCHDTKQEHSGHSSSSPGALCVNCHMPKTSYALLSGIRSHTIRSPKPTLESRYGRGEAPQACSLCHVDRTSRWLSANTQALIKKEAPPLERRQNHQVPWAIERALAGNAAERAVLLSAMSSPEALFTAGRAAFDVVVPYLERDDYAAIRHMVRRATRRVDDAGSDVDSAHSAVPLSHLPSEELEALVRTQDDSPIVISE